MVRAIPVLVTVLAAAGIFGCSDEAPAGDAGTPDAPPARDGGGDDVDAPPGGQGGLTFAFHAVSPAASSGVVIDEVRVWLRDVRAIGDSAPGDSRTSLEEAELDARSDRDPDPIAFPLAPPGLYSRLDMSLGQTDGGGGRQGYEIRGSVTLGATTYELEVEDSDATDAISVALGAVAVEDAAVVTIGIDLSFLAGIDWSSAPTNGDKITLDSSSALVPSIRAGLVSAFQFSSAAVQVADTGRTARSYSSIPRR